MRLAFVYAYLQFPEPVYDFLVKLASRGHAVEAFSCFSNSFQLDANVMIHGVSSFDLGKILPLSTPYPLPLGLTEAIETSRPELIDCQSQLFMTSVETLSYAKRKMKPAVLTILGVLADRSWGLRMGQIAYLRTIGRRLFNQSTLVRCLSNGDAREVIALGCPPAKIRVVPGFVDTKVFAPGYTEREDSLIWVGRFVPEKRLDLLIRAQEILTERRVNTQLTLVGDGPLFDSVRRLIHRSALEGRVALPGGVRRAAVATYLRRSSIFVFASTKEGMPLSVLEAMSAGKAIVAPNIPSMREIIQDGDNGLFFESGDANSMADRIQTMLLDVALRKRIGANARRTVLAKFSSEKVIEQIENLYNEAISAC